jgi:small nuclear ribonucleoprotein (snRNP)-like protein
MKNFLQRKNKRTIGFLVFILAIISLSESSFTKNKKHGSEVIVQKKDGATIKAVLLTVKNNEVILTDSFNMTGISLRADIIQKITINKKSSVFKGIGLGLVIGGGSGALLGFASGDDNSG